MKKKTQDSLAIGLCLGTGLGLLLHSPFIGIAIGVGLGATGIFSTQKRKR